MDKVILSLDKWDLRFLELAKFIAQWSKDPSTQTGSVIAKADKRIVSVGFNGFPRGVKDTEERLNDRETKYKIIVHCERNAILLADKSVEGCTLYTWPFSPCSVCASFVIQAGITRCVAPVMPEHLRERWKDDLDLASVLFEEAGVQLDILDVEI